MHVFADESERGGYLLVAAVLAAADLHRTRVMPRGLSLPGQRRLHRKTEKDSRRRLIVSRLVAADIRTRVYSGKGKSERVRAKLLGHLVSDAINTGATRLVLDSRDPVANARDRSVVAATEARERGLVYEHMPSSTEPCTWIADAVAWCAGGDWRQRISKIVECVTDIGPVG